MGKKFDQLWNALPESARRDMLDVARGEICALGFDEPELALRIAKAHASNGLGSNARTQGKDAITLASQNRFTDRLANNLKAKKIADGVCDVHGHFAHIGITLREALDIYTNSGQVNRTSQDIIGKIELIAGLISQNRWPSPAGRACDNLEETLLATAKSPYLIYVCSFGPENIHKIGMLSTFCDIHVRTFFSKFPRKETREALAQALLTLHWDQYENWAQEAGIPRPDMAQDAAERAIAPLLKAKAEYFSRAGQGATRRRSSKPPKQDYPVKPKRPPKAIRVSEQDSKKVAERFRKWRAGQPNSQPN